MKFAHSAAPFVKPGMTPLQRCEQLWRELELCDELGFEYGFIADLHFESALVSIPVFCTAGAARTRNIRLGPMGYCAAYHDPITLVEESAVLDNVLNGRYEIGLVTGNREDHYQIYNADWPNRNKRAVEAVQLFKSAFASEGPFSFEGPFHQYKDIEFQIKPVQKPRPPIWWTSRQPDMLQFMAREGVNTASSLFNPRKTSGSYVKEYLRTWEQAGHQHKPNVGYLTQVYVDETDEIAMQKAAEHLLYTYNLVYFGGDPQAAAPYSNTSFYEKRGDLGSAEISANILNTDFLFDRNLVFVGSPETVTKQVKAAAKEGLINTIMCEFNIGAIEEEDLMRSIRLFGTQVIPALKGFEPY